MDIDFDVECTRLKVLMDKKDSVNIFLSEGAGTDTIIKEREAAGETFERDAFGHVALDLLNPGEWFAKQFTDRLEAEKTLVQKSGYFGRSAAPNKQDLDLIKISGKLGAQLALAGQSGVIGLDDEKDSELSLIEFERIKGGKPFNTDQIWFNELLTEIGQRK
jgi:pyrophosphate--fructose-6-phosphate 1-phosphotransferase